LDSIGNIIKCSSICKTCASSNYQICTSCYGASTLNGGICVGCSDQYALDCPKNIAYATSCIQGYSSFKGICKACDSNCKYCGNEGATYCDDEACNDGYVILFGTHNCTKCFGSCSKCNSFDPSMCVSCAQNDYLDNSSKCSPCPS